MSSRKPAWRWCVFKRKSSPARLSSDIESARETKAVSESGKKLAGAAKSSFVKKCFSEAG